MFSINSILFATTSLLALAAAAPSPHLYQLEVTFGGYPNGCLEVDGAWNSDSQTVCSSLFTKQASSSGYTITSAAGPCGLVVDRLECGASVTPAVFSTVNGGLGLNGVDFTADTAGGYLLHKHDSGRGNFPTTVLFDGILNN